MKNVHGRRRTNYASPNDHDRDLQKSGHRSKTTTIVVARQVGCDRVEGRGQWVRDEWHLAVTEEMKRMNG
jgi:hypothetical protein